MEGKVLLPKRCDADDAAMIAAALQASSGRQVEPTLDYASGRHGLYCPGVDSKTLKYWARQQLAQYGIF